jgi:hypothetical protein
MRRRSVVLLRIVAGALAGAFALTIVDDAFG